MQAICKGNHRYKTFLHSEIVNNWLLFKQLHNSAIVITRKAKRHFVTTGLRVCPKQFWKNLKYCFGIIKKRILPWLSLACLITKAYQCTFMAFVKCMFFNVIIALLNSNLVSVSRTLDALSGLPHGFFVQSYRK